MHKVGYLGIPGSYSHIAATKYFVDQKYKPIGKPEFKDIFEAIKSGEISRGVIPIENTLAGSIYENYDLLDAHDVFVVGECYVKIVHNLLVTDEGLIEYSKIRSRFTVYSHPKALEQCKAFLDESRFDSLPYSDTANAAKFVASKKMSNLAAVASQEAAELYGLSVAASGIQANKENYTRFLVIGPKILDVNSADKCSLIIYMPHVKGSLYSVLGVLVKKGCNIMKVESRPLIGKPFEYVFYFDFQYDPLLHNVGQIVDELREMGAKSVILGVYKSDNLGS